MFSLYCIVFMIFIEMLLSRRSYDKVKDTYRPYLFTKQNEFTLNVYLI